MNEFELNDLICILENYNPEAIEEVKRAYYYAEKLHEGQFRQSGEPYIIHPLNVAIILAILHADCATVCAGLLHDTLEDTEVTYEQLSKDFGEEVAMLVDGVTKISNIDFLNSNEKNMANMKKLILGIMTDVRIIIIKLADRLHNMRTLEFKNVKKQRENALETLDIFAPLAGYLGEYRIKEELEDLSLKYIYPDKYKEINEYRNKLEEESLSCLSQMLTNIKSLLDEEKIPNEVKIRFKNIYGIFKELDSGLKMSDIHDLIGLKIAVDNIPHCYNTLGIVHSQYHLFDNSFRDYIYNPKTNMYRSLHTVVFGPDGRLVQTRIRTFDMDKIDSYGLTTYWDINKGEARDVMQKQLQEEYQFYKSLDQINKLFTSNDDFIKQAKEELFSKKIYVYPPDGKSRELPFGATPIDFAYKIHTELGNKAVKAIVNGEEVPLDYRLKDGDIIKIISDENSKGPSKKWLRFVVTAKAQRRIRQYLNSKLNDKKSLNYTLH